MYQRCTIGDPCSPQSFSSRPSPILAAACPSHLASTLERKQPLPYLFRQRLAVLTEFECLCVIHLTPPLHAVTGNELIAEAISGALPDAVPLATEPDAACARVIRHRGEM